jgi:hypothetical protein
LNGTVKIVLASRCRLVTCTPGSPQGGGVGGCCLGLHRLPPLLKTPPSSTSGSLSFSKQEHPDEQISTSSSVLFSAYSPSPVDLLPSTSPPLSSSSTSPSFSSLLLEDVALSFSAAPPSYSLSVPYDLDLLERTLYTHCRPGRSSSHLAEGGCQYSNELALIAIGFCLARLCWCVSKAAIWQARTDVFAVIACLRERGMTC